MKTVISSFNGLKVFVKDEVAMCQNMCAFQQTIEQLFAPLFMGVNDTHYRITDQNTLFQLSNGTTAVTTDGQPVGRISDISGNGNHATQVTATARALLDTRLGQHILTPDYIDDFYNWPLDGVTGTFWFSSQFGCQVFTLDAFSTLPTGQFFECGFFGRILSESEKEIVLSYAESTVPVQAEVWDGELIAGNYAASNFGIGVTANFTFEDNTILSSNPPYSGVPFANHNVVTGKGTMKYNITYPTPNDVVALIIGSRAYTSIPQYASIGIFRKDIFSRFPNIADMYPYDFAFGTFTGKELSDNLPTMFFDTGNPIYAGSDGKYGLVGRLPDLRRQYIQYGAGYQSFSGIVPNHARPEHYSSGYYNISGNKLTGSIPTLSLAPAILYYYLSSNLFTGYEGGGLNPAATQYEYFYAHNNLLTQAAIDLILSDFAATIGTIVSGARQINIGGTGNSAPSAAGIISKNNLIAAGWTVTTN